MKGDRRGGRGGEGGGPPRRGRAEWSAAAGGPMGPGGPGYEGPGLGPGFGPGRGPRGGGRGWAGAGPWGWPEGDAMPVPPPEFRPVRGHLREFHRHGPRHRRGRARSL